MTFEIFRSGVMTFRSSREHCGRLDGSDMASFDGVVLGNFVAQVKGIRFSDLECLGCGLAEGRV